MPTRKRRPEHWPDWFDPKGYPHFDPPIRDPESVRQAIESPALIAKRAFLPFIHFGKTCRKFKRDENAFVKKTRPLAYASHMDSLIFRRYNLILSEKYEEYISNLSLRHSVLAYRRFEPPKCNIHFANDAFRFVESKSPCVAMAFDVKDFFESLDHGMLKNRWKQVLGVTELPPDHYSVFKAITKYSKVSREMAFAALNISKRKQENWQGPMCTPVEFRSKIRPLIEANSQAMGIPQGSGISALLANMYMLPVDTALSELATSVGGLYFRYSDDILLVCTAEHAQTMRDTLSQHVSLVNLKLHDGPGKFTTSSFGVDGNGLLKSDRPLQYLGFSFDGQFVRIRSQTFARYLRKMRKAVRRESHIARIAKLKGGSGIVRKKRLYRQYTHLGAKNFISYTQKAAAVFPNSKIREQAKKHWQALHAMLKVV